jgi:hypothetical protein
VFRDVAANCPEEIQQSLCRAMACAMRNETNRLFRLEVKEGEQENAALHQDASPKIGRPAPTGGPTFRRRLHGRCHLRSHFRRFGHSGAWNGLRHSRQGVPRMLVYAIGPRAACVPCRRTLQSGNRPADAAGSSTFSLRLACVPRRYGIRQTTRRRRSRLEGQRDAWPAAGHGTLRALEAPGQS